MVMVMMKVLPSLTFLVALQQVSDYADDCIFCHLDQLEPLTEEEQEEKEQLLEEVGYNKVLIWTWFPFLISFLVLRKF